MALSLPMLNQPTVTSGRIGRQQPLCSVNRLLASTRCSGKWMDNKWCGNLKNNLCAYTVIVADFVTCSTISRAFSSVRTSMVPAAVCRQSASLLARPNWGTLLLRRLSFAVTAAVVVDDVGWVEVVVDERLLVRCLRAPAAATSSLVLAAPSPDDALTIKLRRWPNLLLRLRCLRKKNHWSQKLTAIAAEV